MHLPRTYIVSLAQIGPMINNNPTTASIALWGEENKPVGRPGGGGQSSL